MKNSCVFSNCFGKWTTIFLRVYYYKIKIGHWYMSFCAHLKLDVSIFRRGWGFPTDPGIFRRWATGDSLIGEISGNKHWLTVESQPARMAYNGRVMCR